MPRIRSVTDAGSVIQGAVEQRDREIRDPGSCCAESTAGSMKLTTGTVDAATFGIPSTKRCERPHQDRRNRQRNTKLTRGHRLPGI